MAGSDVHRAHGMQPWAIARAYVSLVVLPIGLVIGALSLGSNLAPSTGVVPDTAHGAPPPAPFDLARLTLQIVVVVAVARLAGALMERIGQPRVIGEILGGIVLGPTVLGLFAPTVAATLFPPASLGFLNALAQFGLLLFMFLLGLELDLAQLRRRAHIALVASHASISVPFLLGVLLSLFLYTPYAPAGVSFTPFALFIGAAMSVTAFPVLARILRDRGMTGTMLGTVAIACAAVDDVTAWCILAGVSFVARASDAASLVTMLGGTAAYLVAMLLLGRRMLRWLSDRSERAGGAGDGFAAGVLLLALASAWVTERLGIHGVFGAFLAGALVPRGGAAVRTLSDRLQSILVVLLLPLFFAFSGLRTSLTLISGTSVAIACAVVLLCAVAGKLGGSTLAARAAGMPWREALSLGVLMNTRGLMELVILNVGLDMGILSPTLFAIMVIMALVTTAMTAPMLTLLQRRSDAPAEGVA